MPGPQGPTGAHLGIPKSVRHRARSSMMREAGARMCSCSIMRAGPSDTPVRDILVTLCRFDSKPLDKPLLGPFIPCERRLANRVFLEIQGRDFTAGF